MRGHRLLGNSIREFRQLHRPCAGRYERRAIQISATPTIESPILTGDVLSNSIDAASSADARFEVLGAPYSLLSVSLSASQKLYTRRGTLVGLSGKAENAQSTLSVLEPFRRAALGIPFLYQRITSTTPITALISTKSPLTSFTVIHLNGTVDWMVAQRKALLAWTGHTLSVSPTIPSLGLGYLAQDIKFFRVMKESDTWRGLTRMLFNLRTAARRTIWGDRLFLKFHGPTTILMSSRASRMSDVLTARDVNEIATTEAGILQKAITLASKAQDSEEGTAKQFTDVPTGFHMAEVGPDGKVKFEDAPSVPR
ncbi:hypothetical protein BUE80_DR010272 [Diplocarpon rosae]|nr:hypothetical protein BUE80_DR010272 [Diplocarpon rosae]